MENLRLKSRWFHLIFSKCPKGKNIFMLSCGLENTDIKYVKIDFFHMSVHKLVRVP